MKIINRTGEVFNDLQIINELGKGRVIARCLLCNSTKEYTKGSVIRGATKSCGCKTQIDNKTGKIFKKLKVIKDTGGEEVECECLICGSIKTYNRQSIIERRYYSCGCKKSKLINTTGKIYKDLQVIKELLSNRVMCRCVKCGHTDEYNKHYVKTESALCKNCGSNRANKTGSIFNQLEIIEESGKGLVICKCVQCGYVDTYSKSHVTTKGALCKKCGLKRTKQIDNKVGMTFGTLKIIEERGKNKVLCKCTDCNGTEEYIKGNVVNKKQKCKNCGLTSGAEGKIVNNIKILNFAYTGRDGKKYYNCQCIKCKEELTLTREEIVKYICDKR